jgi:hypothetical protein
MRIVCISAALALATAIATQTLAADRAAQCGYGPEFLKYLERSDEIFAKALKGTLPCNKVEKAIRLQEEVLAKIGAMYDCMGITHTTKDTPGWKEAWRAKNCKASTTEKKSGPQRQKCQTPKDAPIVDDEQSPDIQCIRAYNSNASDTHCDYTAHYTHRRLGQHLSLDVAAGERKDRCHQGNPNLQFDNWTLKTPSAR